MAVAVKMDKHTKTESEMLQKESSFWTDSTTVLRYNASENVIFKVFVANRLSSIIGLQLSQWMFVNSELNKAKHTSH